MDCNKDIFFVCLAHRMNCICSGIKDLAHVFPCTLATDTVVSLVSNLNHSNINTCIQKRRNTFGCILRYCCNFLIDCVICPGFRCFLFSRICPEIRIMEIDQHFHACVSCPFSDFLCFFKIVVTTAVSVAIAVIWIIPHTDTHIVDTRFFQLVKKLLVCDHITIPVLVGHTAVS